MLQAMKKFTGGLGDDDDRETGDMTVWQRYFTKVTLAPMLSPSFRLYQSHVCSLLSSPGKILKCFLVQLTEEMAKVRKNFSYPARSSTRCDKWASGSSPVQ